MLQKLNFKPGFNKQATDSGAEGQWVDGDFVRLDMDYQKNRLGTINSKSRNIQSS